MRMFKCFLLQFSCFQQPHFDVRNNLSSSNLNCKLTVAELNENVRICMNKNLVKTLMQFLRKSIVSKLGFPS